MDKPEALPVKEANIPAELKALDRWVVWRYELRKGKWAKPPRQTNDRYAASNDPHTWTSFDEAIGAYQERQYDGVGLVLPDGIVGVDLDDCVDGKSLTEEAKLVSAMIPSYTELSPSGTGIKMIVAGNLNSKLAKTNHAKGVELYDGGDTNRYFTITGNVLKDRKKITGQRDGLFAIQSMITEPISTAIEIGEDPEKASKAIEFLENISSDRADNYDDWLKVGMSLHWCDASDDMLERWLEWSQSSLKFDEQTCRDKWDSFKRVEGRLLTLGFLEKTAKEDGYDPTRYQTGSITGAELLGRTFKREYLIDGIFAAGEPMVIGGPSKSLKTSIALDMALSIATGTKFLGTWNVQQAQRVMFISGESGEMTLQENLRTMIQSRELHPRDLDNLQIGFKLPKLDDAMIVDNLIEELRAKETRIVFVDPLYRSLRVGDAASNVYAMGAQLELIAEKIHKAGITVVLLHHFRKQGRTYTEPPELEDLSQAGMAEFGRQFILLKRREQYEQNGMHHLWFTYGGSAGHQGKRILEAHTGIHPDNHWNITLRSEADYKATQKEQNQLAKESKNDDLRARILELIEENPGIRTQQIIQQIGGREAPIRESLNALEYEMAVHWKPAARGAKEWFIHVEE